MENDEPLLLSSSSDEDEGAGDVAETSQPITRKRPAGGHTPLDLASCQKVMGALRDHLMPHSVSLCPPVFVCIGEEPVDLQKQSDVCLFQQQEDETHL